MPARHGQNDAGPRSIIRRASFALLAALALAIGALASSAPASIAAQDTDGSEGSPLTIVVWACPPGSTPETVSLDDCANATGHTTFTLQREGGGMSFTWTTGDIEGGGTGTAGLAPGTYTITQQDAVEGATASFWRCGRLGGGAPAPVYVEGETLDVTIADAGAYRCDWIVVSGSAAIAPTATPVAPTDATVHTVSHACPSGVEPVADATVLIDACHGRPPADTVAEVKLSGMKANWFKLRTSTFEDSGIEDFEFDEVEPGQVVIRQTVPDGYTQAMVFCADGTPDTATFGEPESWNEGAIIELEPGDVVTCRLFIFPAA